MKMTAVELSQQYLGPLLEKHYNNQPIYYEDLISAWKRVELVLTETKSLIGTPCTGEELEYPSLQQETELHSLHASLLKAYDDSARQYYQSILRQVYDEKSIYFAPLPTDFKSEKLDEYLERCKKHVMTLPSLAWAKSMDELPRISPEEEKEEKAPKKQLFHVWRVADEIVEEAFWIPFRAEATRRYKEGLNKRLEHLRLQKKMQSQSVQETAPIQVSVVDEVLHADDKGGVVDHPHVERTDYTDQTILESNIHQPVDHNVRATVDEEMDPLIVPKRQKRENFPNESSSSSSSIANTLQPNAPHVHVAPLHDHRPTENWTVEPEHTNDLPNRDGNEMMLDEEVYSDQDDETDHSGFLDEDDHDPMEDVKSGEEESDGDGEKETDKGLHESHSHSVLETESNANPTMKDLQSENQHASSPAPLTAAQKRLVRFSTGNKEGIKSLTTSLQSTRSKTAGASTGNIVVDSTSAAAPISSGNKSTDRPGFSNRGSKRKMTSVKSTGSSKTTSVSGSNPQQQQQQPGGRGRGRRRK